MATSSYELRDIKDDNDNNQRILTNKLLPGDTNVQDSTTSTITTTSQLDVVFVDGSSRNHRDDNPNDNHNLVFLILLIHGIGTLMPWNMFINAESYFRDYKLASQNTNSSVATGSQQIDIDEVGLGELRKNFISYLGLASQLPNVLFNGLNLIVNMGSGNLNRRVNLTLIIEGFIFSLTIALAMVDSSHWPKAFFYITMLSVVILNMASGIYQNCIFGTGAKFPGIYTNAILIGSNLSGTFTSTVNLLSIWLAPEPKEAAIYYFITALFVILICIISYNILPYNKFFRFHDLGDQDRTILLEIAEIERSARQQAISEEIPETLRNTVDAMVPRPDDEEEPTFASELRKKKLVFMKCWPQCLNVFLTFYVTLALFPSVLANVDGELFSNKYYIPFACFFIFNLFAMIGNLISGWTTWPGKDRVWIMVVARFLFVPFFLFCKFNKSSRVWPVLIKSDIAYIIANILLATSSGYLSSLCMMFASSGLEPDEAPKAGMLAAFFLVFGIFLGINSSFILTWIVELG